MAPRKSFLLRIDPGLWNQLEAWAQDEFRSVNGQIEYLLKLAVEKRKGAAPRAPAPAEQTPASGPEPSIAEAPAEAADGGRFPS